MPAEALRNFFKMEASSGIILIFAAALALLLANSPLNFLYQGTLDLPIAIQVGALEIHKPLLLWVNDGLMAVFFFLVGLEIKREFMDGELSSRSQVMLPALAAIGGMAAPALIYAYINQGNPANMNGWAIPTATDIAFALGVLALLGSRVPISLKILLTAIAIIDDLAAIIIIALFYTDSLSIVSLIVGAFFIIGLIAANRLGVVRPAVFVVLGIGLWVCVLKSGVHATLAGVITALAIPMHSPNRDKATVLTDLEYLLHPWVAFFVLPVFAFANAGVSFGGMSINSFLDPVTLGITLGLFAGKQLGVFTMLWLGIKFGFSQMPAQANWTQLYAVSLLCGIGFTMSLFIGSLAFEHSSFDASIRLGVLTASCLSAISGYLLLRHGTKNEAA